MYKGLLFGDGSLHKGPCHQVSCPEFNSRTHMVEGKRELIPESCLLFSTCLCVCTNTHTQ